MIRQIGRRDRVPRGLRDSAQLREANPKDWWRPAVVYQIYPRSFADGIGDGIGSFEGVTSRPEYLHRLGVGAVWLSPSYLSPQRDGGYVVANFREVDPVFGTVADSERVVRRAHEVGICVVANHPSRRRAVWLLER